MMGYRHIMTYFYNRYNYSGTISIYDGISTQLDMFNIGNLNAFICVAHFGGLPFTTAMTKQMSKHNGFVNTRS